MMLETRDEIVNWLMWEIGKPYEESCNEFDRTIEYINDTISNLREMDQKHSEIKNHNGIFSTSSQSAFGSCLVFKSI